MRVEYIQTGEFGAANDCLLRHQHGRVAADERAILGAARKRQVHPRKHAGRGDLMGVGGQCGTQHYGVRTGIDHRQKLDIFRIHPNLCRPRQGGQFNAQFFARLHVGSRRLRHGGADAQRLRVVERYQRPPRHCHVAQRHGHLRHHPRKGRAHHVQPALRAGCPRLRKRGIGLGARRLVGRLGAVQCGLADVVLPEELALAFQILGGQFQRRGCRLRLRIGCGSVLFCGGRINAQQYLTGLDALARFHLHLHHCAGHLCGDNRLPHGLDHAIESVRGRIGSRLRGDQFQR